MPSKQDAKRQVLSDSGVALRSTDVPDSMPESFWRPALRFQFLYSLSGLILGGVCMALGALMFVFGIAGKTTWTASAMGLESTLTDSAPGGVLFVVGMFVVIITRYVVRVRPRKHG